jgi:hypothetical protein
MRPRSPDRIEAVDAAVIEFGIGERALVGHDDAESRIGEPDRPVGRHRDIVGRVDPPALEMRHDRLGLVVVAAAADAAPAMLAMDERAVGLDGVAVHEPGAVDHDLDMAIGIPAEQPPVGHVGPDEPLCVPCQAGPSPWIVPSCSLSSGASGGSTSASRSSSIWTGGPTRLRMNKVIVVTGAGAGVGLATATRVRPQRLRCRPALARS